MVHAKHYETMSTFVKVMQKKLWPLFFPDTVYIRLHRHWSTGHFFLWGIFARKKYFDSTRKTAYLTWPHTTNWNNVCVVNNRVSNSFKIITLPDSPHTIIIVKTNFGHSVSLDEIYSMFSFKMENKCFLTFAMAAVFCPKNFATSRKKILVCLIQCGYSPPPPSHPGSWV